MQEWEEDYSPASYNGIPFFTDQIGLKGGRRIQIDELPLKDVPMTKDLGKKAILKNVNAYLIGTDYHKKRDELVAELDKGGVADLVLPTYDLLKVRLLGYEVNEGKSEGGFCTISMEFVESGDDAEVGPKEDDIFAILNDVADAIDLSKSEFAKKFDVNGLPKSFIDKSLDTVARFTRSIDNSYEYIRSQGSGISELSEKTKLLVTNINALFSKPGELGDVIAESIALASGNSNSSNDSFLNMSRIIKSTDPVVEIDISSSTPNQIKEINNNNELNKLQRRVATLEVVKNISDIQFSNITDVMEKREYLTDVLNDERNYADAELFEKISIIKSRLVSIMPEKITNIPNVTKFKAFKNETAIVFLYRNTGTIDDLDLFLERNNLKNQIILKANEYYEVQVD